MIAWSRVGVGLGAGLTVILGLAGATLGAPWWPSEPGSSFTYTDRTVSLTGTATAFSRLISYATETVVADYAVDKNGDVLTHGWQNDGGSVYEFYEPAVLWLDLPLAVGKTWSTETAVAHPDRAGDHVVTGRVLAAGIVTAPAGTFDALVVEWTFTPVRPTHAAWTVTRHLHDQLGPVTGLVSWTGVVAGERTSWGGLKARYGPAAAAASRP